MPEPKPDASEPFGNAFAGSSAARGEEEQTPQQAPRRPSGGPWLLVALLLMFLLGMLGSPWLERQVRAWMPPTVLQDDPSGPATRIEDIEERIGRLEVGPVGSGKGGATDLAQLTARIASLEAQATALQASDSNLLSQMEGLAAELARTSGAVEAGDAQVRDLFLLAVVRRMVEAGRPLGPVLAPLSDRFTLQDRAAVDALTDWSAAPQTRGTLADRLAGLEEKEREIANAEPANWWDKVKSALTSLVTVRNTASPQKIDRLDRIEAARLALGTGDIGQAIVLLETGSQSTLALQWVAEAKLLLAAEDALSRLESRTLDTATTSVAGPAVVPAQVPPPVNMGSTTLEPSR